MRYLFFIQQLYSYSILRPLQEAIRTRGDEAAWFVQGTDELQLRADEIQLQTVTDVKKYNPAAVFAPGNWVPDFFPGIKVEVFHGLANDQTGKKGHFRIRGLFDLYCTHAPEVTHQFQELAARHRTFTVNETGWPKLDPLFDQQVCQADQHPEFKTRLRTNKPVVLYASTFSPSLTSAPVLFDTIRHLTQNGQYHWLITLHPKTPTELVVKYRGLAGPDCTFIESNFTVLPLLKSADVMLCDTSSIALEFMLLDKPLVTFRTKMPGPHVIDTDQPQKIAPAIAQALSRPDGLLRATKKYIDALHPYRDGQSSIRILEAVDHFIQENTSATLQHKPLNFWRKMKMRRAMNHFRW